MFDGLFELVDTWCINIDEYEYQLFLKQLEFRMKYSGQGDNQAYDLMPQ